MISLLIRGRRRGGESGWQAEGREQAGIEEGDNAAEESRRACLEITVTAVLPVMTPFGDVGKLPAPGQPLP